MKENLTEIVFILDRSGSMYNLADDTIGGFNSFVEDQKKESGEAKLTVVLFNHEYKLLYDRIDLKDVPRLTNKEYSPAGTTALMDAIGNAISTVGARLSNTPEEERPSKVIVVIATDGYENSSVEYNRSQIKDMIEHQREKYSWEFIFIGAGIDGYREADSIGIGGARAMSVSASAVGTANMFSSVSYATKGIRSCTLDSLDESWKVGDIGMEGSQNGK